MRFNEFEYPKGKFNDCEKEKTNATMGEFISN
jgi:hypothetical protein